MTRTAIISGGTRGLGRAITLELARRGYEVLALYRSDEAAAASLRGELAAEGLRGRCLAQDVTADPAALERELDGGLLTLGGRLTLVHNASAPFTPAPLHLVRWSEIEAQLAVAVRGGLSLAQLVLPRMVRARAGTIVNVLSAAVAAPLPPRGFSAYVVAKEALRGLTRALAAEYRARGVRVFSVSPGYMETPMTAAWDDRLRALVAAASPPVSPAEVARLVADRAEEAPGEGEDYAL